MGDSGRRKVICGTHGSVGAAFVCGHLVDGTTALIGFHGAPARLTSAVRRASGSATRGL